MITAKRKAELRGLMRLASVPGLTWCTKDETKKELDAYDWVNYHCSGEEREYCRKELIRYERIAIAAVRRAKV